MSVAIEKPLRLVQMVKMTESAYYSYWREGYITESELDQLLRFFRSLQVSEFTEGEEL